MYLPFTGVKFMTQESQARASVVSTWTGDRCVTLAVLCAVFFPKANSVQAIQKSFGWDCKPRSPLCVRIQNDHTWWYTHGCFFRPFTLSLVLPVPELTGPQSSQPAASRHLSPDINPKIMYDAYGFNFRLTVIFIAFYFNNSKLIPKALIVTTFTL